MCVCLSVDYYFRSVGYDVTYELNVTSTKEIKGNLPETAVFELEKLSFAYQTNWPKPAIRYTYCRFQGDAA